MALLSICVVFVLAIHVVNSEWSIQTYLGDSVELDCDNQQVNTTKGERGKWQLPSGAILESGMNISGIYVESKFGIDGYSLIIGDVTMQHRGIYTCFIHEENEKTPRAFVVRAINLAGPLYHDMFDKYRVNVIRAVISSLTLLVLSIATCGIYKFRYKSFPSKSENGNAFGNINEAFDMDPMYNIRM